MQLKNSNVIIKRLITWIIALAILGFMFSRINVQELYNSVVLADSYTYLAWLTIFCILWFLLDAQNIFATCRSFNHEITYKEMLGIRGITYLLLIISYILSAGGIAAYLKHDKGIAISRGTSLVLFYSIVTQIALFLMAILGCLLLDELSSETTIVLVYSVLSVVATVVGAVLFKYIPKKGILGKVKNIKILTTFAEADFKTYVKLSCFRIVYYASFIIFYYVALKTFHMTIPLLILIAYVPIILLIISMPITPFGMGTSQAAMVFFFKDFGTEANILAFGLVYSTSILLFRGIIGLFFINKLSAVKRK